MNIITLYNDAYKIHSQNNPKDVEEKFKNLLSHGFVQMENYLKTAMDNYDENLFYMVQKLLAFLILADGENYSGEMSAYNKYCEWAGFQPLTPDQLFKVVKRTSIDELKGIVSVIKQSRSHMSENNYVCFVLSLCYMSLFGDKEVDENEYYLITALCDPRYDHIPTWEQFKKEF